MFSVHPKNHRCFLYRGKPIKIVTSAEHYGAVMNTNFDYNVYLKEMQRTGQNQTRVFTFYRELWGHNVRNTLAVSKERPQETIMPWQRVNGRGKGSDGLDKFDLNRWNPDYFSRLKDYVRKCAEHGVICEIVLFCNPYGDKHFDWFPCSKLNNVNGVGSDLDDRRQFMTLEVPTIVKFQERFVRKIVTELNEFDNVYYEICNEPYSKTFPKEWTTRGEAWHAHIARFVREVEKDSPKKHLIAVNVPDSEALVKNPDIDILNHHYPPGVRTWSSLRKRDHYRKPLVYDENYSGVVGKKPAERYAINRSEGWVTILSGCAGFSNLDWTFTAADETGSGKAPLRDGRKIDGRPLRKWLDIFRKLLGQYDMEALVPAVGVLPERVPGYGCVATTDKKGRYILYFIDEHLFRVEPCKKQSLAVTLKLPAGKYNVQMFDPKSGKTIKLPVLQSDGTAKLKIPEFREDVAPLLKRVRS
ncbi:MAG: cellulase family glycosylhydrolase [Sedimentisphaerales bacterium]|nr:cellulase family glycosylhydrolase [Sedimentisphaerales bacterium]